MVNLATLSGSRHMLIPGALEYSISANRLGFKLFKYVNCVFRIIIFVAQFEFAIKWIPLIGRKLIIPKLNSALDSSWQSIHTLYTHRASIWAEGRSSEWVWLERPTALPMCSCWMTRSLLLTLMWGNICLSRWLDPMACLKIRYVNYLGQWKFADCTVIAK